ncbi:MAG TPA: hypothetical protein VGO53_11060, partial [Steroidobacteraceae bacterium]|nr:hypothetical protein [Steroidobacteraceae bacterium]
MQRRLLPQDFCFVVAQGAERILKVALLLAQCRVTFGDTPGHLVEGAGQAAKLVAPVERNLDLHFSGRNTLGGSGQLAEWPRDLTAQYDGEHAEEQRQRKQPRPEHPSS